MFKVPMLSRNLPAAQRDVESAKVDVRRSAVKDLGALAHGDERDAALECLARALAKDASPRVRAEAAVALADAAAAERTGALIDATNDPEPQVRQMAILALGEVSPERDAMARATLVRTLADEAPALRFQALIALHRVDAEAAMEEVPRRLGDVDHQVRYIALRIAEEHWLEQSDPSEAPVNLLKRARHALGDESPKVQLAAAILLAQASDRSGAEQIVAAVNRGIGVDEPEDAQTAVELCGKLRLDAARPGLHRRAWGLFGLFPDRFAFQARVALARLGDPRAIGSIVRGLSAWNRDARTLAVVAAGRAGLEEAAGAIRAMRGDERRADPGAVEEALAAFGSDEE